MGPHINKELQTVTNSFYEDLGTESGAGVSNQLGIVE